MKTRARSASVFVHCFRVFGYSGETRARVVYMASQMRVPIYRAKDSSSDSSSESSSDLSSESSSEYELGIVLGIELGIELGIGL